MIWYFKTFINWELGCIFLLIIFHISVIFYMFFIFYINITDFFNWYGLNKCGMPLIHITRALDHFFCCNFPSKCTLKIQQTSSGLIFFLFLFLLFVRFIAIVQCICHNNHYNYVCLCMCAGLSEGSYDLEWSVRDLERLDWSSASGWDGLSGIWWREGTGTDYRQTTMCCQTVLCLTYIRNDWPLASCLFVFIQQEDALAQAAFEEARRRTRDFEDRDRSHREDMEVRAGVSEDGCVKFRSVSACWKSNMFLCLKEFTSECVYVCILCVCICVHVFSTCACTILLYVLFMHNLYLIPLANILIDSHCQNIWCFKEQFTENAIFY